MGADKLKEKTTTTTIVWDHMVLGASTGDSTHDKVMWRDLMGKASQISKGPLPEHLLQNQNLSVYCLIYYTLLTLQGAIPKHLSLEKVNLELQLVSCI